MDIRMMRGAPAGGFRSALFDFDGTISLIRQGWQQVMTPYFTQVLLATRRRFAGGGTRLRRGLHHGTHR